MTDRLGSDSYTASEIAAITGLCRASVYSWTRRGAIPHKRLVDPITGRVTYRWPRRLIDAWWASDDSVKCPSHEGPPPVRRPHAKSRRRSMVAACGHGRG